MNDIYDIKNILTALSYIRKDTWYIIGIGIIVYLIFIFFLIIFERYYRLREQHSLQNEDNTTPDPLANLELDDAEFFEKISFAVRTHLEQSWQMSGAITKTPQEIYKKIPSDSLRRILSACEFYEYTGQEATLAQKRIIKGLAREFLMLQ